MPIDLMMPKARPGYDWSNADQVNKAYDRIVGEAVRKGKQAGIIVIDISNVPTLQGDPDAQANIADRIIGFQPNARAGTSVMRVIFIYKNISTTAALTRGVGDDGYARVWPALGDGDATQTSAERRLELEGPARAARRVIGALLAR